MITEWKFKRINGFPDYIICNDGSCYSTKKGFKKLLPKPSRDKYLRMRISNQGKEIYLWIQRLVAAHFIGDIEGKEVHHKDNVRWNNHESNLSICSKRENLDYRNESNGWKNKKKCLFN